MGIWISEASVFPLDTPRRRPSLSPRVRRSQLKQTPLHAEHERLGAKLVDFGGWSMPVQYTGILDEHHAVRRALGVFDISHMGQFHVGGNGACGWLQRMLTNNVDRLGVGECQYTFLLNERGGVIDDLIVYRVKEECYLLVVNAAKIDEDFAWMQGHLTDDVEFANVSDAYAGLAVQGPRSAQLFDAFFEGPILPSRAQRNPAHRDRWCGLLHRPHRLHRRGRL